VSEDRSRIPDDEASITRPMSLPAWIYRDPEYFTVECDEVLRPSWQVLCHLADIPAPGDFHTFDFIGEHLVAVRGEDGRVRAFHNVCRHRAFKLADGQGNCGMRLTCPYHAWAYDLDGTLRGAPKWQGFEDLDKAANSLVPLGMEVWRGFVFVRFAQPDAGAATVAVLASLTSEDMVEAQELPRLLAVLGLIVFICVALARFTRLRLLLAGDRPREWLFGTLRDKGFWVRMAATAGLPSSSWRQGALAEPAFWALFAARFVVYAGGVLARSWAVVGAVVILFGHLLFHAGKRLSAREMWRPRARAGADRPILFLRGFDDDQCRYRRRPWQLLARWLDLWSFRQNLDEAMVDELAQFGPVVALGRPGDTRTPFGAQRHYSADADWQQTLADAARSAQAIVLVASDSPGVQWEYALLKNEAMLDKVLLMFRPDGEHAAANRHAAEWMCPGGGSAVDAAIAAGLRPVSLRLIEGRPILAASRAANAAAGVLALRLHFKRA